MQRSQWLGPLTGRRALSQRCPFLRSRMRGSPKWRPLFRLRRATMPHQMALRPALPEPRLQGLLSLVQGWGLVELWSLCARQVPRPR